MDAETINIIIGSVLLPGVGWMIGRSYKQEATMEDMKDGIESLVEMHAPGQDGIQEWKNPQHRILQQKSLDCLTRIEALLQKDGTKLSQLFQGQSEVKAAVQDLRNKS